MVIMSIILTLHKPHRMWAVNNLQKKEKKDSCSLSATEVVIKKSRSGYLSIHQSEFFDNPPSKGFISFYPFSEKKIGDAHLIDETHALHRSCCLSDMAGRSESISLDEMSSIIHITVFPCHRKQQFPLHLTSYLTPYNLKTR